jgi:F-type H+-transporting ATPase subunit epsilon
MAGASFQVEILTPEGKVFDDEVQMVSTRTSVGSIGVMANHTPLLAMLDACELRLHREGGEIVRYAQGEGYLQVGGNQAMLLLEEAIAAEDIDRADIEQRLAESRQRLEAAEADSEAFRVASRDVRRFETFLEIASAS